MFKTSLKSQVKPSAVWWPLNYLVFIFSTHHGFANCVHINWYSFNKTLWSSKDPRATFGAFIILLVCINNRNNAQKKNLPCKPQHPASWVCCLQILQKHNLRLQVVSVVLAGRSHLLGPFQILRKEHDILLAYQNTNILPQTKPRIQTCPKYTINLKLKCIFSSTMSFQGTEESRQLHDKK